MQFIYKYINMFYIFKFNMTHPSLVIFWNIQKDTVKKSDAFDAKCTYS